MLRFLFFCASLLMFAVTYGQNDDAQVRQVFTSYKEAILNDKGANALNYIDSRTEKYYTDILNAVRNSDSAMVSNRSVIDKITIFSIRHRATREEIVGMTGTDLFVYAIEKGMVGKNSVAQNSIGKVTIDGNFAKGQLVVGGTATPLAFHFYKEQGQWKIDLTSVFPFSNVAFKKMVEESGEEENEFLFGLLEALTRRKPGPEIWQKIN